MMTFDPITRKRLQRFREHRRAWYSLLLIAILYLTSLGAELFCNDRPLYLRYQGQSYFPVFFFYPEDTFTGNGLLTRPDYKRINASPAFAGDEENFMIFPLVPFGPQEIIKADSVPVANEVQIQVRGAPRVGSVNIDSNLVIRREQRAAWFFPTRHGPLKGADLNRAYPLPPRFSEALTQRFANQAAGPYAQVFTAGADGPEVELSLSPFQPRDRRPETVRILLRETYPGKPSGSSRSSFLRMQESSKTPRPEGTPCQPGTPSMIFPICRLDSIRRWPSLASPSGKTV